MSQNSAVLLVCSQFMMLLNMPYVCSSRMTKFDIRNYFWKIYGVRVAKVNTRIQLGKLDHQQNTCTAIDYKDNVAIPCNHIFSITILPWLIVTSYVSINTWAYLPIQKRCKCIQFAKSTVLSVSGNTCLRFSCKPAWLFSRLSVCQ